MTAAQAKVYKAIDRFIKNKGYSPTYNDIGAITGLRSLGTIHKHVERLMADGYVFRADNDKRGSLCVVPEKIMGMGWCDRGHRKVFFEGVVCPCCEVILTVARSVQSSPSQSS